MPKTAILVDGGFYRKRAIALWGNKAPEHRAEELSNYVFKHLGKKDGGRKRELYRVFYYDCPPVAKKVYHPKLGKTVDFGKEPLYAWANDFFDALKTKRKFALRMGRIQESDAYFQLSNSVVKKLMRQEIAIEDVEAGDFTISFKQKEVDMKLGLDVASLAFEGIVDQIILIAGDADFVPAAKVARRKGIDFILDPMGRSTSSSLMEHVDGMESFIKHDPCPRRDVKRE